MTRTLVLAVVVAQLLDVATWMAMPRVAEVNPLAAETHTAIAWVLKALLVAAVLALQPPLRLKYPAVGELVAVVAIAAGCIGAGSNLAVLTTHAAEASRPALLVISTDVPVSPGTRKADPSSGTDAGRTPAPLPESAGSRRSRPLDVARGTVGVPVSRSAPLHGVASWFRAERSTAAAGPALRRWLGPAWRGRVVEVCAERCVTVVLSDWCQCYRGQPNERLVDLSDDAFAAIAPLVAGLVQVTVRPARAVTPPATDR